MLFSARMHRATASQLSYAEYARREQANDVRHEYLDGQVFAMAGGTLEHSALITEVLRLLGNQLGEGPCRAFESNARVRTSHDHGTYPDITIVCGRVARDPEDLQSILNPTAIVEVLSPATETYDRSKKFERYRGLPTFVEYVLVSYREPRIETHLRNDDGTWTERFAKAGESIELRSVGATLDVSTVYRGLVSDGASMVLE
jgi:Uma2 family endonuclease